MKRTGYLHDLRYLLHDTGPYHPEMAERLSAIHQGIQGAGLLSRLTLIAAEPADLRWILSVHEENYVRRFEEVCLNGHKMLDHSDNQMCTDSFEIAKLAVGGVLKAVRMVMEGEIDNAFCAVRPPGHHAEPGQAMGFCYFNNVAIAARYLKDEWDVKKIGIIDVDVHHGNGTQHIFEQDPTVFYYSIHQHPSFAFPGTGRDFETGIQAGKGFTKNSLALPGQGDEQYRHLLQRDLFPAFETFQPDFILVSTGFDAHEDDEMSDINLTTAFYSEMMERIVELADNYCKGRLVSVLEGGYCLARLPELAGHHVKILLDGRAGERLRQRPLQG
jgi:acetoin utilization deacetylase AcuC-like enzyme